MSWILNTGDSGFRIQDTLYVKFDSSCKIELRCP